MEKNLKDYLHLYLGARCKMFMPTLDFELPGMHTLTISSLATPFRFKPILRPLSDLNSDDFYSWGVQEINKEFLVKASVNGMWCSGWYDRKEYAEREENGISVDPHDLLTDLEEADYNNVISCDKSGVIAYGTSDEMRFFVELEVMSDWLNHLRKRKIDVDGLIKAGLAIDATTLKNQNQ